MDKRTLLEVGLKLIGVYCGAVLGLPALVSALTGMVIAWPARTVPGGFVLIVLSKILAFVMPAVYLGIGYVLVRKTRGCLDWTLGDDTP
ncbi:MAG: hypothetical protein J5I93_18525 [Pirellulaceae bacterium]|nr:hypothetical protein [Pirellulaceae bacterium]